MESDRIRLMEEARARLETEKAAHPELFPTRIWKDDNATLELLGIHIPEKEHLLEGWLKLLPSDFIVEEITQDGRQTTIDTAETTLEHIPGNTVYATLVKCGLSTIEAVDELAKLLDAPRDRIQYAGLKDKDAITSQEISIRNIPLEQVRAVRSPHFFLKEIRTGKGVIQKGTLRGNRFTILIRLASGSDDQENQTHTLRNLERIKTHGFYNFFYLQRFGTPRLNNYHWGLSILKGDYLKAVIGLITDPGIREIPFFLEKRRQMLDLIPDWPAVLNVLTEYPLTFPSEIKAVSYLVDHPTDALGALLQIEEQVSLWVSALTSFLYNRKLSTYLMAGMTPPKTLPFFTSLDRNDWLPYMEDLEQVGTFPPDFRTLRPFHSILLRHREAETVDQAHIQATEITAEGVAIQFTLGKGEYATTFLSHLVTLLSGQASNLSVHVIDTKRTLEQGSSEATLERFQTLNIARSE